MAYLVGPDDTELRDVIEDSVTVALRDRASGSKPRAHAGFAVRSPRCAALLG